MANPITPISPRLLFVDKDGFLTTEGKAYLDSLWNRTGGVNSGIPDFSGFTSGIIVKIAENSAAGVYAGRTLVGSADIGITNATGVAGNPAFVLLPTVVTAGIYSVNGTNFLTVDAKGRLSAINNIVITAAPSGTAGGDLSGTYPNPTVAKINGVSLGTVTATSGNILAANGTQWVSVAVSGDITINSSGVTAIGATKVTNAMLAGSIAAAKLVGTDIATVGTITVGTWNGTKISEVYGGTNQSTYTLGDILYASAANTLNKLAGNTATTKKFLRQTGDGVNSAAPAWDTIIASDVPGSALTKTDDTNVTLTLGGSASTALLNAASITLGWTGILAASRGGTGISSLGTGIATWLGTPSSANLASAITDETGSGSLVFANSPTLTTPVIAQINDASGNATLKLVSVASAVNQITITNSATGNMPVISATGSDTNIDITITPKGLGGINVSGSATTPAFFRLYEQTTNGTNHIALSAPASIGSDRVIFLPDATTTLVGTDTTQTLTNKTLTSPVITTPATSGVTNASNASAGNLGEYIESVISTSTNFGTSGQYFDTTSILLTAGDWDVSYLLNVTANGSTMTTGFRGGVWQSTGNNTTGIVVGSNALDSGNATSLVDQSVSIPSFRVNVSAPTTYYGKAIASYSVATPQFTCRLSARRIR